MTAPLDWIIDLRAGLPPAGTQGGRPTCLAWAATTAHEHHRDIALSVEYLHWACGPGGRGHRFGLRRALRDSGQPPNEQWTYALGLKVSSSAAYTPPTTVVGPFHKATVRQVNPEPRRLIEHLENGLLPVAVITVTPEWLKAPGGFVDGTAQGSGGHAVTVVGIARTRVVVSNIPADHYLVCVRNSWGPQWGLGGYALITQRAWRATTSSVIVVEPAVTDGPERGQQSGQSDLVRENP